LTAASIAFARPLLAQDETYHPPAELKKLSVEELLDIDVTSVSKYPEKLSEAAAAVAVLTQAVGASASSTLVMLGRSRIVLRSGLAGTAALATGPRRVAGVEFDVNALVYTCLAVLTGAQVLLFGVFAELYGQFEGLVRRDRPSPWMPWLSFERSILVGCTLIAAGLIGTTIALTTWGSTGFGNLDARDTLRVVLPSATAIGLGVIGVFSGLFASLLTLRGMRPRPSATAVALPRQSSGSVIEKIPNEPVTHDI